MQETEETWVQSLGGEDPLDKGMATHSSILAWRIPTDRGARRATVHRVAKSQTRLKRLSMNTHKRGAELGLTGMQFVSEFSHRGNTGGQCVGATRRHILKLLLQAIDCLLHVDLEGLAGGCRIYQTFSLQVPCGPL